MKGSRILFIILDGLGDLPGPGGKTPLQKAHTPAMDKFAREGVSGLLYPLGRGIIPGSDTSHLAMFGYPPEKYYPGRGPLEALGEGFHLEEGDVAFRGNFATIDERGFIVDRRAGRIKDEGKVLEKCFDGLYIEGVRVIVNSSVEHRAVVIFRKKGLSHEITDTDPHNEGRVRYLMSRPVGNNREARFTAGIVNTFTRMTHEILRDHPLNRERKSGGKLPANIILLRGPGTYSKVPSFRETHGLRGAFVGGGALYKGVSRHLGMDTPDVEGATGRSDTNLENKVRVTLNLLKNHDIVFLHIKGTDSFGHDGDFEGKVGMIERIDRAVGTLYRKVDEKVFLVLTGDHTTSCARKRHSSDPVPLMINGPDILKDDVEFFDELSCSRGYLGHISGKDLMPLLLDMVGKGKMYGS